MTRWLVLLGVLWLGGCAPFMVKSEFPKAHILCATWPIVYVGDVKDCPPNRHPPEFDAHVQAWDDDRYTKAVWSGKRDPDSFWQTVHFTFPKSLCERALDHYIQNYLTLDEYRAQRKPPFHLSQFTQLCDAYVWPWGQPSWRPQ